MAGPHGRKYLINLSDVVEIAKLGTGEEFFPFSPCISINRTVGLGCITKHD